MLPTPLTILEMTEFLQIEFPLALAFSQVEALDADAQTLVARAPFQPDSIRPGGTISGPTMMMLADTSAYYLILALRGRIALAVTSSLTIHFLSKPEPAALLATARMLKLGARSAVVDVEIHSEGQPGAVARATVSYSIPAERDAAL